MGDRGEGARRPAGLLDLPWLTGERVRAIGTAVCIAYALSLLISLALRSGPALTSDFVAYQAAGRMALEGRAAEAYSWTALREVQAAILGGEPTGHLGWLNPPGFFFAVIPVSELPLKAGWIVWVLVTALVFGAAAWSILPRCAALAAAFAVPPVLFSAVVGQSGLLTAGLLGLTLSRLGPGPLSAGLALGLLSWKPQLGLAFPLLLAVGGYWTTFLVAAVTVAGVVLASSLAFGVEAWWAFLDAMEGNAALLLNAGRDILPRIQSIYGLGLGLGLDRTGAMILHGASALPALALCLLIWRGAREGRPEPAAIAAIATSFLVTPYVWGYDMPALAMAALFLARLGMAEGFLPFERLLLVVVPAATTILLFKAMPLIGPVAWWVFLGLAWRRHHAAAAGRLGRPLGVPSA